MAAAAATIPRLGVAFFVAHGIRSAAIPRPSTPARQPHCSLHTTNSSLLKWIMEDFAPRAFFFPLASFRFDFGSVRYDFRPILP
jgi:hypothetical protein